MFISFVISFNVNHQARHLASPAWICSVITFMRLLIDCREINIVRPERNGREFLHVVEVVQWIPVPCKADVLRLRHLWVPHFDTILVVDLGMGHPEIAIGAGDGEAVNGLSRRMGRQRNDGWSTSL